ncbi:MAG: deoxyribose-phosphate aldolase [Cyanobacteria bacterium P01_H01_bin.74]
MPILFETITEHNNHKLAASIDSTLLTVDPASSEKTQHHQIETLCKSAIHHQFFAVCVRPVHCSLAKKIIQNSLVKLATVIGFPEKKMSLQSAASQIGCIPLSKKMAEVEAAMGMGVHELDWVLHQSDLKEALSNKKNEAANSSEFQAIQALSEKIFIKVIIETDLLSVPEIIKVTQWCSDVGAGMVKTSTGMIEQGQGATSENIRLIAKTLAKLNTTTKIKASGGIKTRDQALLFLNAGASRLGTSNAADLIQPVEAEKPLQET